jgi:hypothetical protein
VAALAAASNVAGAADVAGCRHAPFYAAPCFSVRGRLDGYNGTPTFRLRPAGSHRLLGVLGGDGDPASPSVLPDNVRAAMTPPEPGSLNPVEGVFTVCPMAADKPGRMRPVCLESATALKPPPPPSAARSAR